MTDRLDRPFQDSRRFRPFAELIGALRFLTRLPVPFSRTIDLPPLNSAMRMFSVVGAVIGAVTGLVLYGGLELGLPSLLAATIACGLTVIVTGALHEDGLADTCDGFGGGRDREQRLLIMRDSRIGTYGAVALMMALMMRVFAMESLLNLPLPVIVALCAAAGAFSRAMMVDVMWASRPARSDGLSVFAGRPSRTTTLLAIGVGGIATLSAGFLLSPETGVLALAAGTAAAGLLRLMAMRMIGGQTGDVCGAVQVCSEISMLAVFAAMNH
jgi:adenosylcobinamide-GDP ribazoletransferase